MGLRDALNNNSSVVTILAVVVLVISLGIIVWTNKGATGGGQIVELYFYDLNTNKIFTAKSDQHAPIDAPSGPTPGGKKAGVMAFIGTCGECAAFNGMTADEVTAAGGFILRLEMFTEQALQALEKARNATAGEAPPDMLMFDMMNATVIKLPKDTTWVPSQSPQAMKIMTDQSQLCAGGGKLKTCLPGR